MPTAPNTNKASAMDIEALRAQQARYQQFLQHDPDNLQLLGDLAELNLKLGEFDAARELLQRGLAKNPDDNSLQFRLASVHIAANEGEQALTILQRLLDEGLDMPAVRYNLAYAALISGQPELTRESLEPIVGSDEVPDAPLLLARAWHHLGDVDQAITQAQAALTKQPNNPEILGMLGLLHFDASKHTEAKKWAEQALKLKPDNHEALITLGSVALDEQDIETAEQHFDLAGSRYTRSGRALAGVGLVHMARMDLPNAIIELKRSTEYMPGYIGTWHALAWAQILTGDLNGAEQSLNSAMALDRNFGETHGGLAVIAAMRGNQEEAERSAKIGLRLDPNSFSARFAQSLLTAAGGDPAKAQKMIEEILKSQIIPGSDRDRVPLLERLQRLQRFQKTNPKTRH
jgi:tetratricopeptide (TPR) repeat protein